MWFIVICISRKLKEIEGIDILLPITNRFNIVILKCCNRPIKIKGTFLTIAKFFLLNHFLYTIFQLESAFF